MTPFNRYLLFQHLQVALFFKKIFLFTKKQIHFSLSNSFFEACRTAEKKLIYASLQPKFRGKSKKFLYELFYFDNFTGLYRMLSASAVGFTELIYKQMNS